MRSLSLCLLIALLTLSGCAGLKSQSKQQTEPSLDVSLARPCVELTVPDDTFDAWQEWVQTELLPAYTDCAIRHRMTAEAWMKAVATPKK